jgi:hypothetical protein
VIRAGPARFPAASGTPAAAGPRLASPLHLRPRESTLSTREDRRTSRAAIVLGLLLLTGIAGGCRALSRGDPPVDRTQDPRIRGEVQARLSAEPSVDAAAIRVEVDGAIVILYGSVAGLDAWQCAIRTAQLVPGVLSVVDYLVIERGPHGVTCLAPRPPAGLVPEGPGPYPAAPTEGDAEFGSPSPARPWRSPARAD